MTPSQLRRFGTAIVAAAVGIGVRLALDPIAGEGRVASLSLFIILVYVGWQCGLWPALCTLILSALGLTLLMVFVDGDSALAWYEIVARLAIYLIVGAGTCLLGNQLRRAFQIARARAEQFRIVLCSLTDAFVVLSPDWRFEFVNDEFLLRSRMTREQLVGQRIWDVFPVAADSEPYLKLHRAMSERVTVEFEVRYELCGRIFFDRVYPLPDGGLAVYSRDVTESRRVDAELRRKSTLLEAVSNNTSELIYVKDRESRLVFANPATLAVIGVTDPVGTDDKAVAVIGDPQELQQFRENDLRVMQTGRSETVEEAYTAISGQHQFYLSTKAPWRDQSGEILGVIGVSRDVTQARLDAAAVRESEQRYRSLFTALQEGMLLAEEIATDGHIDFRCIDVNPAAEAILRRSRSDIVGRPLRELFPDRQESHWQDYQRVVESGESLRQEVYQADLQQYHENFLYRPRTGHLAILFWDITDRKLTERQLEETADKLERERERLHTALTAGQMGFYEWRIGDPEVWWSPEMYAVYDVDPATFRPLVTNILGLIHPEEREQVWQKSQDRIAQQTGFFVEYRVVTPGGEIRRISSRSQIAFDVHGQPERITGIATDITHRKVTEERLQILVASIDDHLVSYDRNWRYTFVNEAACRMLGRSAEQLIGQSIWELFPEAIGNQYYQELHTALREQRVISSEHYYAPFRQWFENHIYPSDHGVTVYSTDITARKLAEAALQESEERFQLFMNHSPTTAFIKDAEGRYLYVNRNVEERFGMPLAEWIGKTDFEVLPNEEEASQIRENDLKVLQSREIHEFHEQTTAAGGTRHFLSFKFILDDRHGNPLLAGMAIDVTDKHLAEERERMLLQQALQATAKFEAIFNQSGIFAGIMEPSGILREVNDLALTSCGYTRDQVLGIPFWNGPWWRGSAPVQERIRCATEQAARGVAFREVLPYWCANGSERVVEFAMHPIRDAERNVVYLHPTGMDITDRIRTERQLADAHRFLNSSLDALSSHIAVLDQNGMILAVNDAWRRFAEENDFAGMNYGVGYNYIDACLTQDDGCFDYEALQGLRDVIDGKISLFEYEYPCHSPTEQRWFLMRATRFKPPGPLRVVIAHEDVTRLKLAEEALKDADRRKDEFLATLAHELRNPLAPVRNGLQVIKLAGDNQELVNQARVMMERQLSQMVHLVDDLLDLSRISRGKIVLRKSKANLAEIIHQAVEASRPTIDAAGHELQIQLPAETIQLEADVTRLTQVFSNLLNNAAKYTEAGGVIRVTVTSEEGRAVIAVCDSGIGIPEAMLQRVFEMFTQVDRNFERSQGGLGIGLSIVKQLVEMHGGTIEASSEGIGKGSEFKVCLPSLLASTAAQEATPVFATPAVANTAGSNTASSNTAVATGAVSNAVTSTIGEPSVMPTDSNG